MLTWPEPRDEERKGHEGRERAFFKSHKARLAFVPLPSWHQDMGGILLKCYRDATGYTPMIMWPGKFTQHRPQQDTTAALEGTVCEGLART